MIVVKYYEVFLVLISLSCVMAVFNENGYKLELVQVLFRHGARTPIPEELEVYDFFDKSVFKSLGIGALTNKGKKQAYDLGCFLRERYSNFLCNNYNPEDVYARSTYSERTKMSLQLVLAGLYPPSGHDVWHDDLKWSPVPYFYTPKELDLLLRSYDRPEYVDIMIKAIQSDEFLKKTSVFSETLQKLGKKTGINFKINFFNSLLISGLVFSAEHMGLRLPDWYTAEMKQTFFKIRQCFFDLYALTADMKKFGTGPIVKTFIENMNIDGNSTNPRKIYLYSAHDDNVALFAKVHGIHEFRHPDFGTSLILEKWSDSNGKVFVKLLVWTPTDKMSTLRLGNHVEFCPIDDYLKIIQPIVPNDDELDVFFKNAQYKNLKKVLSDDPYVKKSVDSS